jgi:hypothetical protein
LNNPQYARPQYSGALLPNKNRHATAPSVSRQRQVAKSRAPTFTTKQRDEDDLVPRSCER